MDEAAQDRELTFQEEVFNRFAQMDDERAALVAEFEAEVIRLRLELGQVRADLDERTETFRAYIRDQAQMMGYLTKSAESCVAKS